MFSFHQEAIEKHSNMSAIAGPIVNPADFSSSGQYHVYHLHDSISCVAC